MASQLFIPRRTFLKGLGASIALPLLEGMRPATITRAAQAGSNAAPVRMAYIFFPNGCIQDAWKPKEEGENWQLSETLKPLESFKSEINVITGLAQDNGRAKGDGPGDHARCASSYLTGAHPFKTNGANIKVGISVDQAAARQVGFKTRLPSLEVGIERGRNAGNCDSGYSCAYSSNISWKTETTPMAKEINPRLVFERMFGNSENLAEQKKRNFFRQSILDAVSEDARNLKQRLGATDRRKIDEYFNSVREIEQRIQRAEQMVAKAPPEFELPEGVPREWKDHIRLMYDLMVLAFQTDSTRITTFMVANAGSNRAYREVGVTGGWHSLSHHGNKEEKTGPLRKIDRYLVEQFAYFVEKMQSVREGEGTLLDNSMIIYGSGIGDGNRHTHHDLPIVLAGKAGGTIKTGRYLQLGEETPMNNLFLSMLDRLDANIDSIGDSSGRLKQLDA